MLIKVRVTPESQKQIVIEVSENTFVVHVKAKKEGGLANKEMLELIAEHFNTKHIKISSGHQRQHKIVDVHTL